MDEWQGQSAKLSTGPLSVLHSQAIAGRQGCRPDAVSLVKSHLINRLVTSTGSVRIGASNFRAALLLLAATLLPLTIYALISSGIAYRDDRREIEAATLARAMRITDAVDARLDGVSAMLRSLATVRAIQERDWNEARRRSLEIAQLDRDWQNVSLIEIETGEDLFALQRKRRSSADPWWTNLVATASGVPQFSNIDKDVDGKPELLAFMQVVVEDSPAYILVVTLDPQLVQRILLASAPREGVSAVVDRRGLFIARTKALGSRIGTPATGYVRNAIRDGRAGIYQGVTYEGLENYTAFFTSGKTGWSTHIAVSSELINKPQFGWRMAAALAGLLGLLLAIAMALVILRFVSARREADERLRRAERLESVGKLTGGIAHDFNNMLAIVIGSLELAHRRLASGNLDVVKYIDNAMDGANRAADLTRRLLAFSRRQPLAPTAVDVNALILATGELLQRTLESNIRIGFELAEELWPTFVDLSQLENALVNLAVNARDAMPTGGHLTITTENRASPSDQRADMVAIMVTDTGVGMAPDVVERAFEPFFTTKEVGRGTGLGLSQIHGFATQSGGDVLIESEPGEGTSVTLLLPRFAGESVGADERDKDETVPLGKAQEILLVVEDEQRVRETNVEALRSLGYTVRHASDAREALSILETQPGVRLMLTDIVMPGMNGRELAERVGRAHPEVRILLATGYEREKVELDQHIILHKPFGIGELARLIRRELDSVAQAGDRTIWPHSDDSFWQ